MLLTFHIMTINLSVTDKGEDQDYIDDDQQFQQNAIEDDFSDAISESSESSINDDTGYFFKFYFV